MKIAVLDDTPLQMEAIVDMTQAAGYQTVAFARTEALIAALRRDTFDLLIIAQNPLDRSGLDVLAWARANLKVPPPMLMVAHSTESEYIADALDAGADGYLPKPLTERVLKARIRALMRPYASPAPTEPEVHCGVVFHEATSTAMHDGAATVLTAKEFALAQLLFRNRRRPLSRAYILETVWGANPSLNSRSLDMHVSRIRTKLNLRPENGFRLTPIYGHGYQLEHITS